SPVSGSAIQWRVLTWMPSSTSSGSGPATRASVSLSIGSPGRGAPGASSTALRISALLRVAVAAGVKQQRRHLVVEIERQHLADEDHVIACLVARVQGAVEVADGAVED